MPRRVLVAVGAITLVGALLRFPTLATQSFWLDEGFTVRLVNESFADMMKLEGEANPHLYYVLAWLWAHPFGSSEFGLRSLSALAGTAVIPVAYAAASRLGGFRVGCVTAAIVATNPLLIWYSQEARSYALVTLLGALSFFFFLFVLEHQERRWFFGWALTSALAVATHYFAAFLVVPELLWLLIQTPYRRRVKALLMTPVVAVGAVLLPLALRQRDVVGATWIADGTAGDLPIRFARLPGEFLTGHHPPSQALLAVGAAFLALTSAALLLRRDARDARGAARIPLALGTLVVIVPTVLAIAGLDYLITRNVISAVLPLAIVVALGAAAPGAARWAIALPAGICVLGVTAVIGIAADVRYQRDNWRSAARALVDISADRPRAVLVSADTQASSLFAYLPAAHKLETALRVSELDLLLLARRESLQPLRPPSPSPRPSPAPGFKRLSSVQAETFTIVRYRAPSPQLVYPFALDGQVVNGLDAEAVLLP